MTNIQPSYELRFMCEYERFGDADPNYMHRVLRGAQRSGLINGFMITEALTTPLGLEIIQFTIDLNISSSETLTVEDAKRFARKLLRKQIIRDTDVKVRHVGRISDQAPMPRFRYGSMRRSLQEIREDEMVEG